MEELDRERNKLETLEAKNRQRSAMQEAENAEKLKALEQKQRELECLETIKKMNAAKARLKVYEQEINSDEEILDLLHDNVKQRKVAPKLGSLPELLLTPSQPTAKLQQFSAQPQSTRWQLTTDATQEDSTTALARVLADSINISCLLVPEPAVFNGDPLKYKDWKMSFQTLIDRKNIPVNEKIYYLRKYVGGPARRAVESYFLLGTDAAYYAAWDTLEERYGGSFLIAKAFRDKLTSWPKTGTKDSAELREFSDFLRGCEAAMLQIKSLDVLNVCSENQKILSKLPDWLTGRWNRKVIEVEEQHSCFQTFSNFVDFITREAKIACNPVTSLHALKGSDSEKFKPTKI
ncbi:Phosphatidylserine decarboxylase proenzyme [Labeo rohita]|uniref:Phosphatidylserine decarboxylase proenzyme n=1 Tax=Labeo rohita TaxID=84645 RepID=A0ABQ8MSI0_LABRO|nr:Phosphatidylserine decarboxylase proenzyme [Labeo rohita]